MSATKKGHRYKGVLNKPMSWPEPVNALALNSPINREKMEHELQLRLDALMRDCNVDPQSPDRMTDLALALASRHVPGFSFEKYEAVEARHAKTRRLIAIGAGMRKRMARGMSQRSAADNVAKQMNRTSDGGKALTAKAVDRLYRRLKNSR
jgi:hypothetical protein